MLIIISVVIPAIEISPNPFNVYSATSSNPSNQGLLCSVYFRHVSFEKFHKHFYNFFISSTKNQCKENLEIICLNIFYNNHLLRNACYHLFSNLGRT